MNAGMSSSMQDNAMETLGGFFRHARERQGLSLDHIATQTRIQQRHLQALEEEDFASLPAKVFTKGFVRSYARSLGLDEDEAVQLFLTSSSSFYEQIQDGQQHVQIKLEAAHRSQFNWKLVLIVFLLIGGALFFLLPEQQETLPPQAESESPLPTESMQEPKHSTTPAAEVSPLDPVDTVPPPPPPSAITPPPPVPESKPTPPGLPTSPVLEEVPESARPLVLEIEATQLTWVVVQSDDQAPHEALLQPGQRVTWKADKQFLLTLGNAAGVVIRLNGESRGPFGKPGQVVRNIRLKP